MSKLPKISIITICLNAGNTIEKAIRSVIDQSYPELEYIVIDGGSTDDTVSIIQRYAAHFAYWHSKPDGSAIVAQNLGLEQATGNLIAFLFADDWYEPGTFQAIADTFLKHPHADMISCAGRIVKFNKNTQQYQTLLSYAGEKNLSMELQQICSGVLAISSRFFNRKFLNKIGNFIPLEGDGIQNTTNDRELLIRAALQNPKHVVIDHLGHSYLSHPLSINFSRSKKLLKNVCYEHMLIAEKHLQDPSLTIKNKKKFRNWHSDQGARVIVREILSGNFKQAIAVLKKCLRFNPNHFILTTFTIPYKVFRIRIRRYT